VDFIFFVVSVSYCVLFGALCCELFLGLVVVNWIGDAGFRLIVFCLFVVFY